MIQLKNPQQIKEMKEAGRITGEALLVARENIREGISTYELDKIIRNHIEKSGAKWEAPSSSLPSLSGIYTDFRNLVPIR